jgi:hypothetical protein
VRGSSRRPPAGRRDFFGVWLVAHADLYRTARMQAMIAAVAKQFVDVNWQRTRSVVYRACNA